MSLNPAKTCTMRSPWGRVVQCKPHNANRKLARGWTLVLDRPDLQGGDSAPLEGPGPETHPPEALSLDLSASGPEGEVVQGGAPTRPAREALRRLVEWGNRHRVEG